MTCEGCGAKTVGFALFPYCEHCSANLCATCAAKPTCGDATDGKHVLAKDDDDGDE